MNNLLLSTSISFLVALVTSITVFAFVRFNPVDWENNPIKPWPFLADFGVAAVLLGYPTFLVLEENGMLFNKIFVIFSFAALVFLAIVDFQTKRIPYRLTNYIFVALILLSLAISWTTTVWMFVGAVTFAVILLAFHKVALLLYKKEVFGGGDVVLGFLIGAMMGAMFDNLPSFLLNGIQAMFVSLAIGSLLLLLTPLVFKIPGIPSMVPSGEGTSFLKTEVPFGPGFVVGSICSVIFFAGIL